MRKLLKSVAAVSALLAISTGANAADMATKYAPPPPIPVLFSWTGFYLGGNIGGAWAQRRVTDAFFGINFSSSSDATFIGGGQIGYNWQFNNFVLGVEGDIDGITNSNRNNAALIPGVGLIQVTGANNGNYVATLAARFGIASDHWLFYGKAGGGWLNGNGNLALANLTTGAGIALGANGTRSGFLGGLGVEYAITNNWTVKGEWDYLSLGGSRSFIVPIGSAFLVGDTFTNNNRSVQMFKVGFNYLFR